MKQKVEPVVHSIAEVCSSWPGVQAVSISGHAEGDTLDPYFVLAFDVFYSASLPSEEERGSAFPGSGAFETGRVKTKDRFLLDDLPVRIEYKPVAEIDASCDFGHGGDRLVLAQGTYQFHRIAGGRHLYDRTGWLAGVSDRLADFPDQLWKDLRSLHEARVEHCVADLGAATRKSDAFFFLESATAFVRNAALALLAANRTFDPGPRAIDTRLKSLPKLPGDFQGRWESFLEFDSGLSDERRFKIASLIAKSLMSLR
ncbi:MAG: hypothetical protein WCQ50_20390 [Spirochaetota bacterium]